MRHVTRITATLAMLLGLGLDAAQAQTTPGAPAPSAGVTTRALAELCTAGEAAGTGYCRGFMVGIGQYHAELTVGRGGRPPVFCLPEPSPTLEAAQASFVAWAQANPQYAGEKAIIGLMRWASAAYPCPAAAQRSTSSPRR